MMMTRFCIKRILFALIYLLGLWVHRGFAHDVLPNDVVTYIEQNPHLTESELRTYFQKKYGDVELFFLDSSGKRISLKEKYYHTKDMQILFPIEQVKKYIARTDAFIKQSSDEDVRQRLMKERKKAQKKLIRLEALKVEYERSKPFVRLKRGDMPLSEQCRFFTKLGMEHILGGLDHILFVLSIILVLTSFKRLLTFITAFTVAHSLTLLLAGTHILSLSSRIVEPIIALSIAYMAITTVFCKEDSFFKKRDNKWLTIFVFGLFHGLGFAGLFNEVNIPTQQFMMPLLFFNVGVELGQLFILVIAFPILYGIYKLTFHKLVIRLIALSIASLAIFWVIQRIFF